MNELVAELLRKLMNTPQRRAEESAVAMLGTLVMCHAPALPAPGVKRSTLPRALFVLSATEVKSPPARFSAAMSSIRLAAPDAVLWLVTRTKLSDTMLFVPSSR